MDFPLISYGSPHLPLRESPGRSSGPTSEEPKSAPTNLAQKLLAKSYHPIGNTLYIDVEIEEGQDRGGLKVLLPSWPDYQARKAFQNYQSLAEIRPPKELHTVDFFI
jgi:hypothetical protein